MSLSQKEVDYFLAEGFGAGHDPQIIEFSRPPSASLNAWLREHEVAARWVQPPFVNRGDFHYQRHVWLLYVPDYTQYVFAKLKWT